MTLHDTFISAINTLKKVKLTFNSNEKGVVIRTCIPFDYAISNKYKDGLVRYHFYDLDSPDGKHNLSILPNQIVDFQISNENFDPANYVKWTPSWNIKRDWGIYS